MTRLQRLILFHMYGARECSVLEEGESFVITWAPFDRALAIHSAQNNHKLTRFAAVARGGPLVRPRAAARAPLVPQRV